ncbi:MAG TPA: serine/threonine-protein kinase [Gemmatimonadaceae bacterium]|nr:serine/threonine-protein kinase [Gemmatimonadaceae bacterium]
MTDRAADATTSPYIRTTSLPPHLADWQLPPEWSWGAEGVFFEHRHYQEIVDALGRSLSLVSVPEASHAGWLESEARHLAHRNHPAIPTTYHYWATYGVSRRGPGYLRRWIAGETIGSRIARAGPDDVQGMLRLLRDVGSSLSYLHDGGQVHGSVSPETVWTTPMGRIWLLGWQWAVPLVDVPDRLTPSAEYAPGPLEWQNDVWRPSPASDQWQLAALCFTALTGEAPPRSNAPPLALVRPDVPKRLAAVIDKALSAKPEDRYATVTAMLRAADRVVGGRSQVITSGEIWVSGTHDTEEMRLRWASGDDYDVLAKIGTGSFGSVWRVRDLSLGREVALKLLHPHVARDQRTVTRFRREAQLTAQLAHPAIVPIYDFDSRGDVSWYTMELAEGGSVADLVKRSGPRALHEIAPQVDAVLDALMSAHAIGVIHRDLKPENVLIDRYRRWRIADFGIANISGEEAAGASGTPAFAAPEQLLGEAQDAAADLFSFAAVLYFVLTGRAPFGEGETPAILARMLGERVDVEALDAEIARFLLRAMSPRSTDRFADAAEMQAAWRDAVRKVLDREQEMPWWRRFFSGEHQRPTGVDG